MEIAQKIPQNIPQKIPWYERIGIWYRRHRDPVVAWSFLTPMIIYFLVMTIVPLIFLFAISFTDWNIISPPKWVGLRNIQKIFSNYDNWFYVKIIGRTIVYAVFILSLNIIGGFFIALLLNQNLRFKGVFRTMWYLPSVFSGAVMAILIKIYLNASTTGVLNMVLAKFGIAPVDWINHTFWTPILTVLFPVWQGIGFTVIFFLAGLQGVDVNLYDAAKIDGANDVQLLRYITIPQMVPMLLFISVTGLIGSMQMWEVPKLITSGLPSNMTYTLLYSIQNDSFAALDMGMGTAQSLVLFIMLLVFIGWQLNQYRKQYSL